ncbi:MAG: dephospho-CoA kinase [Puniceicoccales bacterium]|nr:dephospho-CoA kinase [Puniceicoccales bacterium]
MKIGLTGGICCGKSTVLEIFARYGFSAIDLDKHVHEVLQGNRRVQANIKNRFGDGCIDENNGQVLTDRLANFVFQDAQSLNFLENLVYPEIEQLWQRDVDGPYVVEIPLLFENGLEKHFEKTLCVYANYNEQLSRAIAFRNWTEAHLKSRIYQQMSVTEKMRRADYVIGNNGTIQQLERQVQLFLEHYTLQ